MCAPLAVCELSHLVCEQNDPDLSFKLLDNIHQPFLLTQGILWEQKMLQSENAKVDYQWSRESHQLYEYKISMVCTAMEGHMYMADIHQ